MQLKFFFFLNEFSGLTVFNVNAISTLCLCLCLQRSQRPTDPEEVTNEALRTMCDNTLHLLTTTVGRLADVNLFVLQSACRKHVSKCLTFTLLFWKVLWPKLLYYLTPSQYSNATSPLCKSLIVLGSKKKTGQEPSFNIDFKQEGW